MLYESNEDTVLLEEEINYLQNYIELQKLRFKENVHVDLHVAIDNPNHRIMPLLLISFLENAFKIAIFQVCCLGFFVARVSSIHLNTILPGQRNYVYCK